MHLLKPDGSVQQLKLGDPIQDPDAFPQVNIPVGVWAATELEDKFSYCFLSQIQAPGISKLNIFVGSGAICQAAKNHKILT